MIASAGRFDITPSFFTLKCPRMLPIGFRLNIFLGDQRANRRHQFLRLRSGDGQQRQDGEKTNHAVILLKV